MPKSSASPLTHSQYGRDAASVFGSYGFSETKAYQLYAATDFQAVIADLQAISTPNFAPDLPDMRMPILLLAGAYDEDHTALKAATNKLPNATFASLPGHDHVTAYMQTDLVVELLTKFLAQVEKAALDDATTAKIETIVKKAMTDYPVPGFELCIVKDGQVVYNKGFGLANVASNRPMTPNPFLPGFHLQVADRDGRHAVGGACTRLTSTSRLLPICRTSRMADPRYKDITVRMLLSRLACLTCRSLGMPARPDD
ncbi:MAG: serine hydrolase [Anaerolineae bacterium]|nr:serine hydrolase [Anaerolineae bacterium]